MKVTRVQRTLFPMSRDGEEMKEERCQGRKVPNVRKQGNV